MKIIDLRSDTVTKPTVMMRQAMFDAEVGDDVYGEDPTVNRLEALAAKITGKEASLFVPSGSMGNQIALLVHCERGEEVICDEMAHIFHYEMAAAAVLSGVQLRTMEGLHLDGGADRLHNYIRSPLSYLPDTRLICLENTLNQNGGTVLPAGRMADIWRKAGEYGLKLHLDGARIFNAAVAQNCEVSQLTQYCDSVMFCLSKGLGAPAGSLLAGSSSFIEKARHYRKLLGGGMRQAGILAAAGIVALSHTSHLLDDHKKAGILAAGLAAIDGFSVDMGRVATNMVLLRSDKIPIEQLLARLKSVGVLAGGIDRDTVRLVTHYDISYADISDALARIRDIF